MEEGEEAAEAVQDSGQAQVDREVGQAEAAAPVGAAARTAVEVCGRQGKRLAEVV